MAKTLDFTDMSPRTVKIGDTTTSFTLICGNNNMATDLTNATSITVKLGNASGYLKSATVDPTSLTDSTTDQVTVTFTADLMTSLPAGSYTIEVWVVDSTGTSIYPSDGSTGFTITNNIQSANGSIITTITFDDFVKAMNKAASTIAKGDKGDKGDTGVTGPQGPQGDKGDTGVTGPQGLKGDKGDTGTVDNTGLISAPAFQSLQTKVDNLHVGGRNYALNTSEPITVKGTGAGYQALDTVMLSEDLQGKKVTLSFIVSADATAIAGDGSIYGQYSDAYSPAWVTFLHSNWLIEGPTYVGASIPVNILKADTPTRFVYRFTMPTDSSGIKAVPIWLGSVTGNITISQVLVTTNNVITDWCPNPSEILTQTDYAKIKAAIVALGGALS
ncbi:collagen-like protein [Pediococcus inopinatus]|uniref:collagen-like protein n=1 Tax=Pediococcus inopinatus TaxID=114090 RepID=UPI002B25C815|nr:collagen-like protein [Pediococcus inopinatus]WPC19413.1 collagen-like protein [Pediococcus inopinatus]